MSPTNQSEETPQLNSLLFETRIRRDMSRPEVARTILKECRGYSKDKSASKVRSLSQMLYNIETGKASPPADFLACLIKVYNMRKSTVIKTMLSDRRIQLEAIL